MVGRQVSWVPSTVYPIIGVINRGLYRDNGKENGSYNLGFWVQGVQFWGWGKEVEFGGLRVRRLGFGVLWLGFGNAILEFRGLGLRVWRLKSFRRCLKVSRRGVRFGECSVGSWEGCVLK